MTDDYIAWAELWCPEAVAETRAPLTEAARAYDLVDRRLGDDAETCEFLTRVLWLETAIRLARLGWTITGVEDARWPRSRRISIGDLLRAGV